eukprot:1466815-Rhodomonas_salina.2
MCVRSNSKNLRGSYHPPAGGVHWNARDPPGEGRRRLPILCSWRPYHSVFVTHRRFGRRGLIPFHVLLSVLCVR